MLVVSERCFNDFSRLILKILGVKLRETFFNS